MSGDENDFEDVEGKQVSFIRKLPPTWRSEELGDFLWSLDEKREEIQANSILPRSGPSISLYRRNPKKTFNYTPATGLPRNCYDSNWLSALRPYAKEQLKIKQVDYDFQDDQESEGDGNDG
jgi:hypothetical protein